MENCDTTWLSVIVPVYKESDHDLRSLFDWITFNYEPGIEWIIVIGSDDEEGPRTTSANVNAPNPSITGYEASRSNVSVRLLQAKVGRSVQMNTGAVYANGELLLFLHADTRLGAGWQQSIKDVFRADKPAWAAFSPRVDAKGAMFRIAERWGRWRSRILALPYGDQAFVVRRMSFTEIGRFDEGVQFMEDVDLSRRFTRLGLKPEILEIEAVSSARKWVRHGMWISLWNMLAIVFYLVGMPREQIERFYRRVT